MSLFNQNVNRGSKQRFIRGMHNLLSDDYGNVVTIGSFDGVHLGHQTILRQVCAQAAAYKLPSLVMIFEPQPHEYFSGDKAPARLMRVNEKVQALFNAGIDRVFCLPFDKALSVMSAEFFIAEVLVRRLGVKHLIVGDDFRFGAERAGDYAQLQQAGKQYGFTVEDTKTHLHGTERVSSTRIRQFLQDNHFEDAAKLLGKPYKISGKVVKGNQLGRTLNAPTANVHLHRYRSPLQGVFAVIATVKDERINGVANVGVRPTVGGIVKPILEVHLFDFDADIYGEKISVEFQYKLREEIKFASLDILTRQIHQDIQEARDYFASAIH